MEFNWLGVALDEVAWISAAFILGSLARMVGLPPLIGFLAAGFLINTTDIQPGPLLQKISDVGITLLLFTIGLKLNLRTLARPQVWGVASIHLVTVCLALGLALFALAAAGMAAFAELDLVTALLIAFALSFSSTVFVVKILEERGEMSSLHGRIAIGVLIVQDVAAVIFLALSTAKWPSVWALLVIALLWPLRQLLYRTLRWVGHGELLVLYGFVLALGGAKLFELVGMKGDLGALILGVLIASHAQSDELNKVMLGFKDFFLLGFFLSVGLSGTPTIEQLGVAVLLIPVIFLKSALFFKLFTRFYLRSRTSLLASLNLCNFSEFGLIVAAVAASNGWISFDWLIILALALSLSFAVAAPINRFGYEILDRYRPFWLRFQSEERLAYDRNIDVRDARILVVGMGGVGTGAFDRVTEEFPGQVTGVDTDPATVRRHLEEGRDVIRGDPSDADFWDRVKTAEGVSMVMLALPRLSSSLAVIAELRRKGYAGRVAAIARYSDEQQALQETGIDSVFNIYSEAGSGFAASALEKVEKDPGNHAGL